MKITRLIHHTTSGYALVTVLIFSLMGLLMLGGALQWSSTEIRNVARNNQYRLAQAAAEAAHEKVMSHILKDYKLGDLARVAANMGTYPTNVPAPSEHAMWQGFVFNDAQGGVGQVFVEQSDGRVYTNLPPPYIGLNGWRAVYKIIANARQTNVLHDITAAVQQDVWLIAAPIFQFGIFYNGDLEIHPAAGLQVGGSVHCNGDIWIGSSPAFLGPVSATGNINHRRHPNDPSQANGSPTYGLTRTTNAPTLTLPIGTNNTFDAVYEVIKKAPTGEDPNSNIGQERYFNKAELLIMVTNNAVQLIAKRPFTLTNSASSYPVTVHPMQWTNFMSTNKSFFDQREQKTMRLTEIDVGRFGEWSRTNWPCQQALLSAGVHGAAQTMRTNAAILITNNPPINLLYVADERTTNSTTGTALRLINGQFLPTGGTNFTYVTNFVGTNMVVFTNRETLVHRGLTVATLNPLYVKGNYNCTNNSHLNTTNTASTLPASLVSDALTILSSSWNDANGANSYTTRNPSSSLTVNAAVLTGITPTTNHTSYYSGGVQNIFRMLENWNNGPREVTFNGSMVVLFASKRAVGRFVNINQTGSYYSVPNPREIYFDRKYLDAANLPPGTPMYRDLVIDRWSTLPPNSTNYVQTFY